MRVVLDTNVWLDLLLFEDPRCAALRQALADGRARALIDTACRDEWLRVLAYPTLRLTAQRREELLHAQALHCLSPQTRQGGADWPLPRCRDPDDQKFLTLARDGDAHFLLSRDHALLALAPRLRRSGRFAICTPEDFVPP